MGMGIILSALAAAGDAGVQSMNQNIVQQNALDQDKMRSDLETQKAKTIADYQHTLQNKPMADAQALIQANMAKQIPVDAAPVTGLSDDSAQNIGLPFGFNGDIAGQNANLTQMQSILKNPSASDDQKADAQGAIDQMQKQYAAQGQINSDAVAGKTRTPNADEAFAMAMQDAKAAGNLPALAALKASIPDNLMVLPDGATLYDKTNGKVVMQSTGKADRQQIHEDAADDRAQKRFDAQLEVERMKEKAKGIATRAASDPWNVFTTPDGDQVQNLPHGEEFLKMLPTQAQEQVKALAEGRLSFPTGAAMRSPAAQNLIAAVSQYDPQFDAVNYGARSATRKDFTSGKAATSINAINTVMQHLDEYLAAGAALNNSGFRPWNAVANAVDSKLGDPRVTRFDTTRNAVVDEVEKAYRGSGGSQAGIEAWKENMSSAQSPAQIAESGKTLIKLLEGKIEALGDQYSKGMGLTKNGLELLSPKAQAVYGKVMGGRDGGQGSNPTTITPKTINWGDLK